MNRIKQRIFLFGMLFLPTQLSNAPAKPERDLLFEISEKPRFRPLKEERVRMSAASIQKIVQPLLQRHLAEKSYDRLHIVEEFIDFFYEKRKEHPQLTPLQALASFQPDTSTEKYRGSLCYGLTDDLFDQLPKKLKAIRVPSTIPVRFQQNGWPQYCHSAIVIVYENPKDSADKGYILLDPNFDIEFPVVLKHDGSPTFIDVKEIGRWSYAVRGGAIECRDSVNKKLQMKYLLQHYDNHVQVGVKPIIATDRKISLYSRDLTGNQLAYVNVKLDKNLVYSSVKYKKQKPLSFDLFIQGDGFDTAFVKKLGFSHTAHLNKSIKKIVENRELLTQLNREYMELLSQCERREDFIYKQVR